MGRIQTATFVVDARHPRDCITCAHPEREQIELDFIQWKPATQIAREYHLKPRALNRHIIALGLKEKRNQNLQAISVKIIETGLKKLRNVSAREVNAAVVTLAKLQGKWINRSETTSFSLNEYFRRMSRQELQEYIDTRGSKLPGWVQAELEKGKGHSSNLLEK